MGLKAVKLTEEEIALAIGIYNNFSNGGAYADKSNYDYIYPSGLKETIENKVFNKNVLTSEGEEVAKSIHEKLTEFCK